MEGRDHGLLSQIREAISFAEQSSDPSSTVLSPLARKKLPERPMCLPRKTSEGTASRWMARERTVASTGHTCHEAAFHGIGLRIQWFASHPLRRQDRLPAVLGRIEATDQDGQRSSGWISSIDNLSAPCRINPTTICANLCNLWFHLQTVFGRACRDPHRT